MEILMDKVNEVMLSEGIDKGILDSVTSRGMYDSLESGSATMKDIETVSSVLNCKPRDLISQTKMVPIRDFRQRIKSNGWDQTAFSEMCGVSVSSIWNYCSGVSRPHRATLDQLCWALGCSSSYLTKESEAYGKYSGSIPDRPNAKTIKVSPYIGSVIRKNDEITPSKLAKLMGIPCTLLKKVMAVGGELPQSSVMKFCSIYNISVDDIQYTKATVKTDAVIHTSAKPVVEIKSETSIKGSVNVDNQSSINDLIAVDKNQRELQKHDRESILETAKRYGELDMIVNEKVANLAKPTDGKISLSQLGAAIMILDKNPDLLNTFVEMCNLPEDDFNHVHENLKWTLNRMNSSQKLNNN